MDFIVFTAQCGLSLQSLYIRIITTLVRSSRIRLLTKCNNVFLRNFIKLDKIQSSTAVHVKETQRHGIFFAWKENTEPPALVSLLIAGGKVTIHLLPCQRIDNHLLHKHQCLNSKFKMICMRLVMLSQIMAHKMSTIYLTYSLYYLWFTLMFLQRLLINYLLN